MGHIIAGDSFSGVIYKHKVNQICMVCGGGVDVGDGGNGGGGNAPHANIGR